MDEKQDAQRATYSAPEYNVQPFWGISQGQGGHLVFPISPKNTNLVEDVEILIPVKFPLNSAQRFQRRSRKCLGQSEARTAMLFFRSTRKTQLGRGHWDLASCQVSLNSVQRFQRRIKVISAIQRSWRSSCFSDWPEKKKLGRGRWDFASCQVSLNSVQQFQRRSRKCLSQSEARAAILFFRLARKTQSW